MREQVIYRCGFKYVLHQQDGCTSKFKIIHIRKDGRFVVGSYTNAEAAIKSI